MVTEGGSFLALRDLLFPKDTFSFESSEERKELKKITAHSSLQSELQSGWTIIVRQGMSPNQ